MAAPTRGATVTTQVDSTANFNYTPDSGSNTWLVVWIFQEDTTVTTNDDRVTAVSFGGTSLTNQVDARLYSGGFDAANDCQIWTLQSPGTSTAAISITGGNSARIGIVCTTIIGAGSIDTTGKNETTSSNSTITFSTTATETLVLAGVCGGNDVDYTIAAGSEVTNDWAACLVQPTSTRGEVSYEAFTSAQTSIDSSYSGVSGGRTAHALIAFAAAAGGGGANPLAGKLGLMGIGI